MDSREQPEMEMENPSLLQPLAATEQQQQQLSRPRGACMLQQLPLSLMELSLVDCA